MMKKVLAALLAVCMLASLMFIPASAAGFDDVADDHWAKESIDRWAGYGVLNGKAEGKFDPDANMTRAQFAKFIVTLMGLPVDEDAEMPFEDVKGTANDWAAPYIAAAYKAGIIRGTNTAGTRFAPANNVNFDQSAAMLARAVGLVEKDAYGETVTTKLTELEMLDDNVKADADATRALVAGLADNMIEFYANDAEADAVVVGGAEEATEVKGVILAVNGGKINVENATVKAPIVVTSEASVEVKSSTVEAPIVVDSASVALTETKAADVAVSGEKASVTADKDSTVAEVAVSGTAPSVELNGAVEKVTVAEGTTEVEVKGEGVSAENVTNNTTEEIKVNDEVIEAKPAEPENPDDNQGGSTGFVPDPVTPPADVTTGTSGSVTPPPVPTVGNAPTDTTGLTAAAGKKLCGSGEEGAAANHSWTKNITENPSCTEFGSVTFTCGTCGATKTEQIAKVTHEYETSDRYSFTAEGHKKICKYCSTVQDGDATDHSLSYTAHTDTYHTQKCVCGYTVNANHVAVTEGGNAAMYAKIDGNNVYHHLKCACGAEYGSEPHTWGEWTFKAAVSRAAEAEKKDERTCTKCGYAEERTHQHKYGAWVNVEWSDTNLASLKPAGATDSTHQGQKRVCACDDAQYQVIVKPTPVTHDAVAHAGNIVAATSGASMSDLVHPTTCNVPNCNFAGGTAEHTYVNGTCSACQHVCGHVGTGTNPSSTVGHTVCAKCGLDDKECTATGAGHTAAGKCSKCNKVLTQEEVDALE